MNTSLNEAWKFICRSGRTSTPGWCIGSAKYDSPRCFGTSQFVRATRMPKSAWWADVFQTFCPLTIQRSPSRTAVVVSPARSDPAPGSLNSWHHVCSPVSSGARNRSRTASGPWVRIVGPASVVPPPTGIPTAPAARSSAWTTSSAQAGRSRPEPAARPRRHRPAGVEQPPAPLEQREIGVPRLGDPRPHLGRHRLRAHRRRRHALAPTTRSARRRRREAVRT